MHHGLGGPSSIVTPKLVKKLVGLRFGGNNFDNLSEGIQPFSLAVQDHCTQAALALTATARTNAEEYDLATAGEMSTTLTDARLMRTTSVTLPTDFLHARAMLKAQDIMNQQVLLGGEHPDTKPFKRSCRTTLPTNCSTLDASHHKVAWHLPCSFALFN
jgi:hypothetical protein